jgi:hypothetical protein
MMSRKPTSAAREKKASVKLNASMIWEIGLILPLEWLRGTLSWSSTQGRAKGDRRAGVTTAQAIRRNGECGSRKECRCETFVVKMDSRSTLVFSPGRA